MVKTDTFTGGQPKNDIYCMLDKIIEKDDTFLRVRMDGEVKDICNDYFYLAHDGEKGLSRVWMSYGKHENAVSNWGAVFTPIEHRGNGYASRVLEYCIKEIENMKNGPTALLCTAGTLELTSMYKKYGFKTALKGKDRGPLYKPLKDSPETFTEFCKQYYTKTDELYVIKVDFNYRNEIDCLLKFALWDMGKSMEIDGVTDIWKVILSQPDRARIIITKENKCVGWMLDEKMQLHPNYKNVKKITELI